MKTRKRLTFEFRETREEAQALCDEINSGYSRYMRKKYPAHYTNWSNASGTENAFVVLYHY